MKTGFKIGIGVASVLAVVVVGAVVAVLTVDPNNHKPWIAEKFQQFTGRSLAFEGDIGLTLYPWLGMSLSQVVIGNAPGFDDEPMFRADSLEVRAKLLPLLRQHYEIDTVRLHGAQVNLVVNEAGQNNWSDLAGGSQDDDASPSSSSGLPLSDILLGGIDIQNVSVNFQDLSARASYAISDFSFKTDELVYGVPIDLDLSFNADASSPALGAQVKLDGTVTYDLDNGRYQIDPLQVEATLSGASIPGGSTTASFSSVLDLNLDDDSLVLSALELNVLDTRLQASVTGSNIKTARASYETELALTGSDLSLLFKVAEIEPLATQLAGVNNRRFAVDAAATVDLGSTSINFSRLSANLLGADLSGALLANNITSSTPVVRGNLGASGENLPLLVEVLGQLSGGRDSSLSVAGRELSRAADKSFRVNTEFDANLETGMVAVSALDATLLGTTLQGNLDASEIMSDAPVIKGKLDARGPDLPLLLRIGGLFSGGDESPLFQYGDQLSRVSNRAFVVTTEFDADLQNGNVAVPVLSVNGLGLQLGGNIRAINMNDRNGTIGGSINIQGSNLVQVLTAIGQPGIAEVVSSLSAEMHLSGSRNDLNISPLALNLEFAGPQIPNSPVKVELSAATTVDLDNESLVIDSLSVKGLGLDVAGNISATKLFSSPAFTGQVELASFNLRRLLQQLNQPVPETADVTALQEVAMSTSFSGSTEDIALSDLIFSLDQTTLQGSLGIRDFSQPAIQFNLAIDSLDADRYLPPPSTATQTTSVDTSATEIPTEPLRNLNVQGQLRVQELTIANLDLSALSVSVAARDGELSLAPMQTDLYQGSFSGNVSLNVVQQTPVMQVSANLQQIDVGLFLQDLIDATYVSGRGNVQLTLNGSGSDTDALKRNLNGNGNINLEDGVLGGVDVASVLGQLEAMIRTRRPGEFSRGEQTAFDSFSGNLLINQGIVASNDLLIRSPGFQVSGRGVLLDLGNDTIDFDLVTSVDKATATRNDQEFDIGGYSLPIACSGIVSSPRCLPDAGEILRVAVTREVQQRVGNLINRAIGIEEPAPADDPDTNDAPDALPAQQIPEATPIPEPANPREELIRRALERLL